MSAYDDRPWLAAYPERWKADIVVEHPTVLAAFLASARRRPAEPALRYFDAVLTFAELDALSDGLARALAAGGLRPGDRVAAFLQNVPQMVLTALATWKAGGAVVAVSPMLRHKELGAILDDSGATVLVTLESLWRDVGRDVVAATAVERVLTTSELDLLDGAVPDVLRASARDRDPAVEDLLEVAHAHRGPGLEHAPLGPDDTAVLTYTSGTTGPSKAAMNTHANVVFGAQVYRDAVGLRDDDVILGLGPLFHVTGLVAHLGLGVLTGVPLILAHRFDAEATLDLIERLRPTFTVTAITAYVALMHAAASAPRDLSSLRHTLSGGASIAPAVADAWHARFGTTIIPVYGLTETTGPTHILPPGGPRPVDPASGALTIGVPVPSTVARVLDEAGRDVPPGEPGEIAISGPQIVPGYWRRPEESATVFAGGMMRTGDIGVMDAAGFFYVIDRKKDLINAAGYKVWPREVEDVLLTHPAVREAAVVGVPDDYRGETVQAFVSLKAGADVRPDALIAFCRDLMASYKYPRVIEILPDLPKGATGKILRRELRAATIADRA